MVAVMPAYFLQRMLPEGSVTFLLLFHTNEPHQSICLSIECKPSTEDRRVFSCGKCQKPYKVAVFSENVRVILIYKKQFRIISYIYILRLSLFLIKIVIFSVVNKRSRKFQANKIATKF